MPSKIRHDDLLLRLLKDLNDVRAALKQVVATLPLFDIDNENTPAQLTTNQNNYNPGNYDVLRLSSNALVTITGIRRGIKGRRLRLFNVGSFPIVLAHQSVSSDAENRFKFSSAIDATIPPSSTILLYYDATQARWIGGDTYSSGAIYAETINTNQQSISIGVGPNNVDLGAIVSDQYGFIDIANDKIEIQFDGSYFLIYIGSWDEVSPTDAGNRELYWYLNTAQTTTTWIIDNVIAGIGSFGMVYAGFLSAGDVLEIKAFQGAENPTAIILANSRMVMFKIN